jgi:hypothetical protein
MIKVSTFLRECLNEIEMKKYLPPYKRELISIPPHSSESLYSVDGTCTTPHTSVGIEMFQGKKKKKFKKNSIPPPPSTEPSCTTAPPWGRGDWNAIEPPANARNRTKFINWNFTSKLFSRNQERGACSMSIQPTFGWNHCV